MKLRDLTPEEILDRLDKSSDFLADAQEAYLIAEGQLKMAKALAFKAARAAGKTNAEAEHLCYLDDDWSDAYMYYTKLLVAYGKAKRGREDQESARDLYRSELATIRAVGL